MRILFKQQQGDDVHLYNLQEISDFESHPWRDGLDLGDWLNQSIIVDTTNGAAAPGVIRTGHTLTLRGSNKFVRDQNRTDVNTDYWVMTETGLMIQLSIVAGTTETGTILDIVRSPWMFRTGAGDTYNRNWNKFGDRSNIIEPIEITDIVYDNANRLLSEGATEASFPQLSMTVRVHATRLPNLRLFKFNNQSIDFIQYRWGNAGPWTDYNNGDTIRLSQDDNIWIDSEEFTLQIRYIATEAEIHKIRDEHIHSTANWITSPTSSFMTSVTHDGLYDTLTNDDQNIFADPFNWQDAGVRTDLGSIQVDNLKMKFDSVNPLDLDIANNSLQNSEFDGGWFRLHPNSFTSRLTTVTRQDGEDLPNEFVGVGDNGTIFRVTGGSVIETFISNHKWTGTNRLTGASTNGSISVNGDNTIHDMNMDGMNDLPQQVSALPVSYNNFATLNIYSSGPLNSISIKTRDNNAYVPYGTIDVLRAEGETEWNTIYNRSMNIGEFHVFENNPLLLQQAREKPSHHIIVTFRKIPGYLFDVGWPNEVTRSMTLDIDASSKVYTSGAGSSIEDSSTTLTIDIKRDATRFGLYEIPTDPLASPSLGTGNTSLDDNGLAHMIARRVSNSSTFGLHHPNLCQENWQIASNRAAYDSTDGHPFAKRSWGDDTWSVQNIADGPHGLPTKTWRTTTARFTAGNGNSSADGGWQKKLHNLDIYSPYVSIVFWRRIQAGTGGSFYHGVATWTPPTEMICNKDGTKNNNPYFHTRGQGWFTVGDWYVSIGYIHAYDDADPDNWGGGIWHLDSGTKVHDNRDYRFGKDGATNYHRTFMYYTRSETIHEFAPPMFCKLGGIFQKGTVHEGFLNGFSPTVISNNNPDIYGSWRFDGSLDNVDEMEYTDIVGGARNVTSYNYTAGVLFESQQIGTVGNDIGLEQSSTCFNIPKDTLLGGADGGSPAIQGGQPGPAIDCFAANTTINNAGVIRGDITNR